MQLASASKERLILAPSRNRSPRFSVTVPRSDPAKSINESFELSVFIAIFLVL